MSCCCEKTYKFCGPVSICDVTSLQSLFTGIADGTYTISLDFLGKKIDIPMEVASGEATISPFHLTLLNESFTYSGQVINSAGANVPLVFETISYDCFQFETYV